MRSSQTNVEEIEQSSSDSSAREDKPAAGSSGLVRKLGLFDMTMIVMGSIIGSAIFLVPHTVASLLRAPGYMLSAWILGGIVTLAGSLVYAELARRRPQVGGQYAYLREAYHPGLAFVYGWSLLLVVQTGAMASVAVVFAQYFLSFTHAPVPPWIVTTAAIGTLSVVNCLGVRAGSTTQNMFMALKIIAILTLIVCGLLFVNSQWSALGGSSPGVAQVSRGAEMPDFWQLVATFGAAMVPILFSYGGSHMSTFIAGEVRDPERNLPGGLIIGVAGVVGLYLAVNFVCLRALGPDQLATTATKPASAVMGIALGETGATIIAIGIAISALGYLSQATLTSPRVYFAMAKDGLFFKSVAWVHPRTHVPVVAIALQGVFAIVIALTGKYEGILNYVMSVDMGFISLAAASLFIFRRRDAAAGPESGGYVAPGHPVTTIFFVGVILAVAIALFYKFPLNSTIGVGIALAGVPVYFFWRWKARGA